MNSTATKPRHQAEPPKSCDGELCGMGRPCEHCDRKLVKNEVAGAARRRRAAIIGRLAALVGAEPAELVALLVAIGRGGSR